MKKNKKVIFGISVFLVLVVVCVFFVYSKNKNTMQTPFYVLANALNHRDFSILPDLFPEYYTDKAENVLSVDKFQEYINRIIDECGENYKVSFEIIEIEEWPRESVEGYAKQENLFCDRDDIEFEAVYDVKVWMRVQGSTTTVGGVTVDGNDDEGDFDICVVKMNGKYYFSSRLLLGY